MREKKPESTIPRKEYQLALFDDQGDLQCLIHLIVIHSIQLYIHQINDILYLQAVPL